MSMSRAKRKITYVNIIYISGFSTGSARETCYVNNSLIPVVYLLPGSGTDLQVEWEIFSSPEFFCAQATAYTRIYFTG